MFGYVTPIKDELKVKEFEIFKGYYCGICTELGKINYPSKYLLNYDVTFLALLLSSLEYERDYPKIRFCPYTVKRFKYYSNEFIRYGAILNVLLANRKILDNYYDEKNYLYLILSKIIRFKGEDSLKDKVEAIDKHLCEITQLEKQNSSDIDKLSHHFGKVTETLFDVFEDKRNIALKYFGYNLGRWIYVIDALDDLKKDLKSGEYNPLKYAFNYKGEAFEEFRERILDTVRFTLYSYLENITKSYELLDFKKNKGILDNIIYLGLADKTEKVLKGENRNEKSIRGIGCEGERFTRGDKESL